MSIKKKAEDKAIQSYKSTCKKGDCPSLTEIKNSRIRKLAERLTASSDRETLTNISEWHNNNMNYWFERYPPWISVSIIFFVASLASFLLTSYSPATLFLFAAALTLLILTVCMASYYRRIPLSEFCHVFDDSISFDFLLDRKLGVCRDYAKLSAALLFNIYPEREIYFVYARSHVSTGIMVGNKLYILDKYLPVTTFLKWNEKWNKGKFSNKKVKRAIGGCMFSVDDSDSILPKANQAELDKDNISRKLEQIIGIQDSTDYSRDNPLKIWKWKNGAKLYEDDEIVNYSIARRLETIISREMLNKNQIAHIEINLEKHDLVFSVFMK